MMYAMELRLLRSFVVVAEELNVGRAASLLHLTQPSLVSRSRRSSTTSASNSSPG